MTSVPSEYMRTKTPVIKRLKVHPDFIRKARVGELVIRSERYDGSILNPNPSYGVGTGGYKSTTVHDESLHKHKDPIWHLRYRSTAPEIVHPLYDVKNQSWKARAIERGLY